MVHIAPCCRQGSKACGCRNVQTCSTCASGSGLWWALGECRINGRRMEVQNYGIYSDHPSHIGSQRANLWATIDEVHNYGAAGTNAHATSASAVYLAGTGVSTNWRSWLEVKEIRSDAAGSASSTFAAYAATAYGNHYLISEKVGGPVAFTLSGTGDYWLAAQKVHATAREALHVDMGAGSSTGIVDLAFQTMSSAGVRAAYIADGNVVLRGGTITQTNGYGVVHAGGRTLLNGVTVQTDAVNLASNRPVVISATGLVMNASRLIAPAAADSIWSSTAQTNTVNNGLAVNRPINSNVTIEGGTVTLNNGNPNITRIDLDSPSAGQALLVHSASGLGVVMTNGSVSGGSGGSNFVVSTHGTALVTNYVQVGNEVSGGALRILSGVTNASGNVTNVGAVFSNSNPALVGFQMPAPTFEQWGNGWKTTATAGSQPVGVQYRLTPVQGTTTPTAKWGLHFGTNGTFGNNSVIEVQSGGSVVMETAQATTAFQSGTYRGLTSSGNFSLGNSSGEIINTLHKRFGIYSAAPTAALHVNAGTNGLGFKVSSAAFTNLVNVASNGFHATVYAPMTAALGPHWVTNGMSAIWNSNGLATYIRSSVSGSATNTDDVLKIH